MRKVAAWVTADNVVHLSHQGAKSHADNRYGTQLCKLARELVAIDKYTAMVAYLQAHGDKFVKLAQLKADIEVEREEND